MKVWIIPSNPEYYDVIGAFNTMTKIYWRQNVRINSGDIVYIYVSKPYQSIKYLCLVEESNVPVDSITFEDEAFWKNKKLTDVNQYMLLSKVADFDCSKFTLPNLQKNGLNGNIQSARPISGRLLNYIYENTDYFYSTRIIYCNLAYMKKYQGHEDGIKFGGEYIKRNGFGHEENNFLSINGYCYGFVQSSNKKINISRIDENANGDTLENVLVVWTARRETPKGTNRTIIGFYKNATVYADIQPSLIDNNHEGFYFQCKEEDAILLDENQRIFAFSKSRESNIGQANIWYADGNDSYKTINRTICYINEDVLNNKANCYEESNEELEQNSNYSEGKTKERYINVHERNPLLREKCIKKYGYECQICYTNLEDIYGEIAKNFIHVHHIKPISEYTEEHIVDPEKDLITICPNCHAIIHRTRNGKSPSIEELRMMIKRNSIGNKEKIFFGQIITHSEYGKGKIVKVLEKECIVEFYSQPKNKVLLKDFIINNCLL